MTYEIVVEETEEADIEEAYAYYRRHAPHYAGTWRDGLREALRTLSLRFIPTNQ